MLNYCPGCGEKNSDREKFCSGCGSALIETTTTGSLTEGTVLDKRYEIKSLIKTGGMGSIYQAIDKRFNNKCAVKEMALENIKKDAAYMTARFQKEAKLLRTLHHPGLPRVIDYFIEQGNYYLVMDFVEGQDLEELLDRYGDPGLPEKKIAKWAMDILDILNYLHSQNPPVIYRDMKPSNIMIKTRDAKAMLVDFGIARSLLENLESLTMTGTPHYAPPEQFKGQCVPQSDLFSLGATIHHLLSGKIPAPCIFKPLRQINPKVSASMEALINKALELKIPDRFENADDMKMAFIGYLHSRLPEDSRYNTAEVKNTTILCEEIALEKNIVKEAVEGVIKEDIKRVVTEEFSSERMTKKIETERKSPGESAIFSKLQSLPTAIHSLFRREVKKAIIETKKEMSAQVTQPVEPPKKKELAKTIFNEIDNSVMVLIPGGEYRIGNDASNPLAFKVEYPRHIVNLKPYYMDKYAVTNIQYCKFLNIKKTEGKGEPWIYLGDTGCKIKKVNRIYRVEMGYEDHPVVCVTWYGAKVYSAWAGKRLPTEAEWEAAARGPERREYPWGNEWSSKKCSNRHVGGCGKLMPVGAFPQGVSYFGVEDMAGNVWEWCEDWLNAYPGSKSANKNFGEKFKIIRGGAWFLDEPSHFRSSFRRWYVPTFRYYFLGFRCCRDVSI